MNPNDALVAEGWAWAKAREDEGAAGASNIPLPVYDRLRGGTLQDGGRAYASRAEALGQLARAYARARRSGWQP